ncbi:MAG: hypothetical protein IPG92_04355 [Flavobacteriales bacterium]|nr:hypothetical protein [Flavobacteriales bacterium]
MGTTTALSGSTATAPQVGTWSIETAGITGTFSGGVNNPTATFTHTGGPLVTSITLRWTITNAPCSSSQADITITVNDADLDGVCNDGTDNCPTVSNASQINTDGDSEGDACDGDDDNDGVADGSDNDQLNPNSCVDADGDGCDDCSGTHDGFGVAANNDVNDDGPDNDSDGLCDSFDTDDDNDGTPDTAEIACGSDPLNAASTCEICDGLDNDLNDGIDEGFTDTDSDGQADCVDGDDDNDGVADGSDNASLNPDSCEDADGDGCDDCSQNGGSFAAGANNFPANDGPDADTDGICDSGDNCVNDPNPTQANADADALGDACDACPNDANNDADGDLICGDVDTCPTYPGQVGDFCDADPGPGYTLGRSVPLAWLRSAVALR